MMDKTRWSELKKGNVQPANDEERTALNEYRKDQHLAQTFWFNQISEPVRQYRGTQPKDVTLRGFGKSEREGK